MRASLLKPRKQPRQARASLMVETILEAAARVLAKQSLSGFNTNRVAEVAGISVGSLYQYFPNKGALVAALIAREQAALGDAIEQHLDAHAAAPLAQVLSGLIEIAIAHQFGDPVYAAALDHEEKRLPLEKLLANSQTRIMNAVASLLHQHRPTLAQPLPPAAALDCLTIAKALIESEAQSGTPDLASVRARVLRALTGYLQHQVPQRRRVD